WQYGVYVWDKAGRSATLGDLSSTVPVPVRIEDEHFEHVIPAKLDCRKCHESADHAVLGFSELQLNAPFGESDRSQLDALTAAGVLDAAPESAAAIVHSDPLTREALGYLTGNCVHCHNGGDGPSSAFDLRHAAAIDNLVDQPAEGELATGVRVVPGHPERSVLFRALRRDLEDLDVQPMPPVGVDRVDQGALDLFEAWIRSLATN